MIRNGKLTPGKIETASLLVMVLFVAGFALLKTIPARAADAAPGHINLVTVKDTINPGVEEFLKYAVHRSEDEHAECLIILLDTPGGLMTSMRGIAQSILNSRVPVVVYVYPSGAQAASAGVFVTAAADIAAMAPGTNIGAAHPVTSSGGDVPSTMSEKVMNDMLAFARSIAEERGRNAEWLQEAVKKSVSATAHEAFEKNVIDLVVSDVPELVKKLDGWQISHGGATRTLHTAGEPLVEIESSWQYSVLRVLANPNIAYMLLMIGLAGLYFEFSTPGAVIPGVVGGISLILALFALQTLPVNLAGILLILLGMVFFLLEIKISSYGTLSFAGVLCLALGSLMLFRAPGTHVRLAMSVFIPTLTVVSGFFWVVATLAYRAHSRKPRTGAEVMVGLVGEVRKDLDPEGKVFIYGELWNARADAYVPAGSKVKVLGVENLKLKVKKIGDT